MNTSALLSAYQKPNGEYVLNGVNREFLKNIEISNTRKDKNEFLKDDLQGLNTILKYDKFLFDNIDIELRDKYCKLIRDVENSTSLTVNLAVPVICTETFLEGCQDNITGDFLWGGLSNAPPHLDHDGDGILNDDDRDFQDLLDKHGITKQQFLDWIFFKWKITYENQYGSYEEFWLEQDEWDGEDWDESSWDDIHEEFYEICWDWDDDEDPFDEDPLGILNPDPPGQEGPDTDCYPGTDIDHNNSSGSRDDADCTWYFVLECTDGTNTWVEEIIENGDESNQHGQDSEYKKQLYNKVRTFEEAHHIGNNVFNLYSLANSNCSPFAPQAEFEACLKAAMFNEIHTAYPNILPTEYYWGNNIPFIRDRPSLMVKIKSFLLTHSSDEDQQVIEYFIWAISTHNAKIEDLIEGYDTFGPNNDSFTPDQETRIDILDYYVPVNPPMADDLFAETEDRPDGHAYYPPNTIPNDLKSGTDGDINLLSRWLPKNRMLVEESDDNLLAEFNSLIHDPILNSDLQHVATTYFDRFKNSTGGDYFNEDLSTYILTNSHMIATVKDFGNFLNKKLKEKNGDILQVNVNNIDVKYLAKFDSGEMFSGLKILMNDTEKLLVYSMNDYIYNPDTKEWEASFYFKIYDNFGLDNKDLLKFQGKYWLGVGKRFAAWWILQHIKGYKPFRTEIRTVFKIKGNLNN